VRGSPALAAPFAALPIVTLLVLLGGLKVRAHLAAAVALGMAVAVATTVYGMPLAQTAMAALEGVAFGLFPILWIVVTAMWVFNMTVESGHFDVLRRSIEMVSEDQRVQAVMISFCFGSLLEALAGFGAPVAITSMMLVTLGFAPIKAAALALVANTAPVPFGALGTPITTLSQVTGLEKQDLGAMVGRQVPVVAVVLPLVLVAMVDGGRGVRQAWPCAVVAGLSFGAAQVVCSNLGPVELTDIVAAVTSMAAVVSFVGVRKQWAAGARGGRPPPPVGERAGVLVPRADVMRAFSPYLIIVATLSAAQLPAVRDRLAEAPWTATFRWPGLDLRTPGGTLHPSVVFHLNWVATAGTLMLLAGLLSMAAIRLSPARALAVAGRTLGQLRWTALTVVGVLALAYVVNLSGQTATLGLLASRAGAFVACLSPLIGWLGVAVTGSDTASNALFGGVQVAAAHDSGLSPLLLAAGNSSGGVFGKMGSAQHLAIAVAAVGMPGQEGVLMRRVLPLSMLLLLCLAALVQLQSIPVLDWTVIP
jgi:lactate permease